MNNVFFISEFSHESGIGQLVAVCSSEKAVVNYLTHNGNRHGRLTDEHDIYVKEGMNIIDMVKDKAVLKFTPEIDPKDNVYIFMGREPDLTPLYYIIHVHEVVDNF